jgi:tRNA 2-thiouridine synthesizing protein A
VVSISPVSCLDLVASVLDNRIENSEEHVSYSADQKLDASGLTCPLPLLKAKQALNGMDSGQILNVICTDSGSVRDFQVFCQQSGNQLLQSVEENGTYIYYIRKL